MPRDINSRIDQLSRRRRSLDRLTTLSATFATDVLQKSLLTEGWQKRATNQPYTRYTLGAMAAVDADDTRLHRESAEKIGKQLHAGLSMQVEFQIQGSVALDVHIRGVSDIDLLVLDQRLVKFDRTGQAAGTYVGTSLTSIGALFALSGGSLARPVDVVPSHWWDTVDYQQSRQQHDRGVVILNKKIPETIENLPFLHIKRVHDRDAMVLGGLKKTIRLVKNVKADADNQAVADGLPSFDIAALMYHADLAALAAGYTNELSILKEARRFFDWCYGNKSDAIRFRTPDNTRTVLNSEAKWSALVTISRELDDLAKKVAAEQNAYLSLISPSWIQVDVALASARIHAAA